MDQGLQALLGRGVISVVEAIHFQAGGNCLDIRLGGRDFRLVGSAHELRHHNGAEHADDDHHHHDFNQRKTALALGHFAHSVHQLVKA